MSAELVLRCVNTAQRCGQGIVDGANEREGDGECEGDGAAGAGDTGGVHEARGLNAAAQLTQDWRPMLGGTSNLWQIIVLPWPARFNDGGVLVAISHSVRQGRGCQFARVLESKIQ